MSGLSLLEVVQAGVAVADGRFDREDLGQGTVDGLTFMGCLFSYCKFDGCEIRGCQFLNCKFSHCTFKEARFTDCVFFEGEARVGTDWQYCDFAEGVFRQCNLGMNRIVKSEAYMLAFEDCAAMGMNFEAEVHKRISNQLLMGGVRMSGCKMQYAVFAPADYTDSRFEGCDLRDCNFAGSNLSGVSFKGSALENVDFRGAVLDGAVLAGAGFEVLDLSVMASHHGMMVGRGQHEAIVETLGLVTLD